MSLDFLLMPRAFILTQYQKLLVLCLSQNHEALCYTGGLRQQRQAIVNCI